MKLEGMANMCVSFVFSPFRWRLTASWHKNLNWGSLYVGPFGFNVCGYFDAEKHVEDRSTEYMGT